MNRAEYRIIKTGHDGISRNVPGVVQNSNRQWYVVPTFPVTGEWKAHDKITRADTGSRGIFYSKVSKGDGHFVCEAVHLYEDGRISITGRYKLVERVVGGITLFSFVEIRGDGGSNPPKLMGELHYPASGDRKPYLKVYDVSLVTDTFKLC